MHVCALYLWSFLTGNVRQVRTKTGAITQMHVDEDSFCLVLL